MGYIKQIVCLANSRKPGGRCIAGKEWNTSSKLWIRPVSSSQSHSLCAEDRQYEGGKEPDLLDIINISMIRPEPLEHQHENHLIDNKLYWTRVGRTTWDHALSLQDNPSSLWSNNSSSTGYLFNRVPQSVQVYASLFLLAVETLEIVVGPKSGYDPKKVAKGRFMWRGTKHVLQITDPMIEVEYGSKSEGTYVIENSLICVSLGDPFEGLYYKLIAAVLHKNRFL